MMDELDRMFRRLVHNIRAGFPDLLTQPFEVASLHQNLIPYRLNRRELGMDSVEEYELTLMRLLSGARGLVTVDPDMQVALRAELESPNPDLSAFRAFATARVTLAPAAVQALEERALVAPPPPTTPRPAEPATAKAAMSARATEEVSTAAAPGGSMRTPQGRPSSPIGSIPTRPPAAGCRYCGAELPDGRDVHFCPHCGQNLSVKQCPACSTELEVEWQFCITCGRQVE
jgi:hypothetical protein